MGLFEPNISKMEEKRDVKGLIKALGYAENKYIRESAAGALARLRGPFENGDVLIEPLSKHLGDPDLQIRRACIETLGKIGSDRAVALLLSRVDSEDSRHVIFALANSAHPHALAALLKELDGNSNLDLVLPALTKYGLAAVEPLLRKLRKNERLDLFLPTLMKYGGIVVEPLCRLMEDKECPGPVRCEIIKALGALGDARAIPFLVDVSQKEEEDMPVRIEIAKAVGKLGDDRAVPLLVSLMKAGRREAAAGLRELGWKPDADETGACYAILLRDYPHCAEIGEPAIVPLISALKTLNIEESKKVATTLARIGEPAIPYLLAALQDHDFEYRRKAADALVQMKWKPGLDTASGAWYWIAREMWEKITWAGADAIPALLGTLGVNVLSVRIKAAKALGKLGDPRGIEVLISILGDEKGRAAACEALDELGWEPGLDEAGAQYQIARGNYDACLEIGNSSVGPLVAGLQGNERVKAARTLVQLYRSGKLDETAKKLIIEQRSLITQPHEDRHNDEEGFSDPHCDKDLWTSHTDHHFDHGIGMEFPL